MPEHKQRPMKMNKYRHRKRFDENDPKYKCCFGQIHLRGAAVIIAFLELNCILLLTAALIYIPIHGHESAGMNPLLSCGFVGIVAGVISIAIMLYGLIKTKPYLLFPHISIQLLAILIMYLFCVLLIAALASEHPDLLGLFANTDFTQPENAHIRQRFSIFSIVVVVFMFILATTEIWFLLIMYCCYNFLKDAKAAQKVRGEQAVPMV